MIALVEGAERQKTPNEIALNILLAVLTLVFLLVVVTLQPFAYYAGTEIPIPVLIALLVCLIPTTIGALISAIGIAGMDRLVQHNVLAMSGRAVEAAGDVDTLLLDKTGTITLGNRQATEFVPCLASPRPSSPTPRSWRRWRTKRPRDDRSSCSPRRSTAFAAASSRARGGLRAVHGAHAHVGRELNGREIRKGAADAIAYREERGNGTAPEVQGRSSIGIAAPAARRWWSPNGRARLASSI